MKKIRDYDRVIIYGWSGTSFYYVSQGLGFQGEI